MSFKDLKFKHSFQSIPDATTSRKFSIQAMQHDSGDALLAQVNSKRLSVDNSPSINEEVHGNKEEARDLQQEDKKTTANAANAERLSSSSDVENLEATADIEKKSDAIGKSTDEDVTVQGPTLPPIQNEGEHGHNETSEKEGSACVAAKTSEISSEKQDGNTDGATPTHQPRPPKMKSFKKHMSLKTRAAMKRSNSTMVGHSLVDKNAEAAEPRRNINTEIRALVRVTERLDAHLRQSYDVDLYEVEDIMIASKDTTKHRSTWTDLRVEFRLGLETLRGPSAVFKSQSGNVPPVLEILVSHAEHGVLEGEEFEAHLRRVEKARKARLEAALCSVIEVLPREKQYEQIAKVLDEGVASRCGQDAKHRPDHARILAILEGAPLDDFAAQLSIACINWEFYEEDGLVGKSYLQRALRAVKAVLLIGRPWSDWTPHPDAEMARESRDAAFRAAVKADPSVKTQWLTSSVWWEDAKPWALAGVRFASRGALGFAVTALEIAMDRGGVLEFTELDALGRAAFAFGRPRLAQLAADEALATSRFEGEEDHAVRAIQLHAKRKGDPASHNEDDDDKIREESVRLPPIGSLMAPSAQLKAAYVLRCKTRRKT
ncbi:Hypothetical Protein FCC1311_099632 [Hondaea fermentalgiana]|uniref:Uncharacterized protein n=1 Tax=Hondaea fermentalgiana TaxID=2315210 RepID=A0A2R5GSB8_9STRA|nr:Hypothetical Protein FCC1311_099632 [Hondaea fermentalgiana]|eukprot:GBG33740.1 Hypothetical Protein FCC1311_099632 [Hondaea fermentalgiana]